MVPEGSESIMAKGHGNEQLAVVTGRETGSSHLHKAARADWAWREVLSSRSLATVMGFPSKAVQLPQTELPTEDIFIQTTASEESCTLTPASQLPLLTFIVPLCTPRILSALGF